MSEESVESSARSSRHGIPAVSTRSSRSVPRTSSGTRSLTGSMARKPEPDTTACARSWTPGLTASMNGHRPWRRFATLVIASSYSQRLRDGPRALVCPSASDWARCFPTFEVDSSVRLTSSSPGRRPSKPPGCGSRRCRRKTWRSCATTTKSGTPGTWRACESFMTPTRS